MLTLCNRIFFKKYSVMIRNSTLLVLHSQVVFRITLLMVNFPGEVPRYKPTAPVGAPPLGDALRMYLSSRFAWICGWIILFPGKVADGIERYAPYLLVRAFQAHTAWTRMLPIKYEYVSKFLDHFANCEKSIPNRFKLGSSNLTETLSAKFLDIWGARDLMFGCYAQIIPSSKATSCAGKRLDFRTIGAEGPSPDAGGSLIRLLPFEEGPELGLGSALHPTEKSLSFSPEDRRPYNTRLVENLCLTLFILKFHHHNNTLSDRSSSDDWEYACDDCDEIGDAGGACNNPGDDAVFQSREEITIKFINLSICFETLPWRFVALSARNRPSQFRISPGFKLLFHIPIKSLSQPVHFSPTLPPFSSLELPTTPHPKGNPTLPPFQFKMCELPPHHTLFAYPPTLRYSLQVSLRSASEWGSIQPNVVGRALTTNFEARSHCS
eukprot:g13955.t1